MLYGKVSKFSITFVLSNFPDSAPVSLSRVLRDRRRSELKPELMFCRDGLI
jgi:hypothetical protein